MTAYYYIGVRATSIVAKVRYGIVVSVMKYIPTLRRHPSVTSAFTPLEYFCAVSGMLTVHPTGSSR